MRTEQVNEMIADITRQLLQKRSSDGIWRGCLSSSAISTSVAIFALTSFFFFVFHLCFFFFFKQKTAYEMIW